MFRPRIVNYISIFFIYNLIVARKKNVFVQKVLQDQNANIEVFCLEN